MSARMQPGDVLAFAATQMRRNPGRSALTAIGITVGVFGLVTIVALGEGLEAAIHEQLTDGESQTRIVVRSGFGANDPASMAAVATLAEAFPDKADRLRKAISKRRRGGPGGMRRNILTPSAVAAIASREHVASARPLVVDRFEVEVGEHKATALSYGVLPGERRWNDRVILGERYDRGGQGVWVHEHLLWTWGYATDAEQQTLVGKTIALSRPRELGGPDALADIARSFGVDVSSEEAERVQAFVRAMRPGAALQPRGPGLRVELPILGVVRERVEADTFDLVEDTFSIQADVFFPQALAEELWLAVPGNTARGWSAVSIEVDGFERVGAVERALQREGWGTQSVASTLERLGLALAILTLFVSGLTAVALLVAVLGIVNTMVMNVSERTREIGVLKALGATDWQVRALFVSEAALLGLGGGLVGVLLAYLASFPGDMLNRYLIQRNTEYVYPGTVFQFPWWLIAIALSFAVLLSVVAAWAPAGRASRIDPVVALRDE